MTVEYTESRFDADMAALAETIMQSGVQYDKILAIARGGITPAARLSYYLKVPMVLVQYSLKDDCRFANLQATIAELTPTERTLIVDDISDSGNTLIEITASLAGFAFDTATILYKPHTSAYRPTYFAATHDSDEWVEFYWEKVLFAANPLA